MDIYIFKMYCSILRMSLQKFKINVILYHFYELKLILIDYYELPKKRNVIIIQTIHSKPIIL